MWEGISGKPGGQRGWAGGGGGQKGTSVRGSV